MVVVSIAARYRTNDRLLMLLLGVLLNANDEKRQNVERSTRVEFQCKQDIPISILYTYVTQGW
jgi:hypothetical protein